MKTIEYKLKDGSGTVYINSNKNKISINFRYSSPVDNNFLNWGGHYRCEIENNKIIEEVLPVSTNYNRVTEILNNVFKILKGDEIEIIKQAYLNKMISPQRF